MPIPFLIAGAKALSLLAGKGHVAKGVAKVATKGVSRNATKIRANKLAKADVRPKGRGIEVEIEVEGQDGEE